MEPFGFSSCFILWNEFSNGQGYFASDGLERGELALGVTSMDQQGPKTISVPEAGRRYFDLSKNASYEAARRGDIPAIRVGRLLRVPIAALERRLNAVE